MSESPTPSPLPELARLEIYETIMDFRIVQRTGAECEDIASVPKLLHRDNQQRARAEQICASVNAHAALVEALRELLAAGDDAVDYVQSEDDVANMLRLGKATENARAALALAEPKP